MMLLMTSRLWLWAAVVRPLKHVVTLGTLVHLFHRRPRSAPQPEQVRQQLESLLRRKGRLLTRAPANCLERSLGAYRLLCAAGAAPEIVVGIRRGAGGGVEGHVWVVVDGRPLAEDEAFLAGFARVLAFDAGARQRPDFPERLPDGLRLLS
jgi:hypothetical protein